MTTSAHVTEALVARSKLSSGLGGLLADLVLMPWVIAALRIRAHRRDSYAVGVRATPGPGSEPRPGSDRSAPTSVAL